MRKPMFCFIVILLSFLFLRNVSPQSKQKKSMKMDERYSFNLIIDIPDKDTVKVNSFLSLAKEFNTYPFSNKKKVSRIVINIMEKDIEESTDIVNAFNQLADKYELEVVIQKLPSKK